jgi:hypothetical protein
MTVFFLLLVSAHADTLALRNGTTVTGRWVSVDADQNLFQVDNQLKTYPRSDVLRVTFGSSVEPRKPAEPQKRTAPTVGQTVEQVTAALGQPQTILDLGEKKKVYVYPDLKITFVDGKVSEIGN